MGESPKSVLLLGRNRALVDELLPALNEAGLAVLVAQDAAARKAWRMLSPDLFLFESGPDAAIWELCRQVRLDAATPIVVLSPDHSLDDVEDAIAWGASEYLVLPLSTGQIVSRVLSVLRQTNAA
jgi:two-component system response regulator MtrA